MLVRVLRSSLLLGLLLLPAMPVAARGGGMGGGAMGGGGVGGSSVGGSAMLYLPPLLGDDGRRYESFEPTKLEPGFPEKYRCSSPATYYGYPSDNGALSLKIPEGTPLRAIATGEVIAKGRTPNADGAFLWLRLAPEDTGHPFWTFTKYQQLQDIPSIEVGSKAIVGEVIAASGATGNFRLTTVYGPAPEFRLGGRYQSMVKALDGKLDDPMILYVKGIDSTKDAHGPSLERKQIAVSVIGPEGIIFPLDDKLVWPVACIH